MMAGLLSLLRLDPMFSIYQKITSGAAKMAPAPRYDWLIEMDEARQLYLATYRKVDTIDNLIQTANHHKITNQI